VIDVQGPISMVVLKGPYTRSLFSYMHLRAGAYVIVRLFSLLLVYISR